MKPRRLRQITGAESAWPLDRLFCKFLGADAALYLAIAGAAASAGSAGYSAVQQDKAAKASKGAAEQAATVQKKQLTTQANTEQAKALRQRDQLLGRLRVLQGEYNLGEGSSIDALGRQVNTDTGLNTGIIQRNLSNNLDRVGSDLNARNVEFGSRQMNSIIASLTGGLQGFGTGLQIGTALDNLNRPVPTQPDLSGGLP